MELDYDSDGLPCPGKPAQKRQRRRVVVEARDPSGRLYTAAEIRRMKRCAARLAVMFPAPAWRSTRWWWQGRRG
jgi:hypothetical protein